jgi:hypothetical protein
MEQQLNLIVYLFICLDKIVQTTAFSIYFFIEYVCAVE